jgi:hypothetical protein
VAGRAADNRPEAGYTSEELLKRVAMNISDLPDPNDRDAVVKFARSFDGYTHFGSFEACARAAQEQRRETLTDLQNELFFSHRASVHLGWRDSVLETYRELLPMFRRLLAG